MTLLRNLAVLPLVALFLAFPIGAAAQSGGLYRQFEATNGNGTRTFASLVNYIIDIINLIIPILVGCALIFFFWGVVRYISAAGQGEHSQGREMIIWGIVALFVLTSIWGLTGILVSTFLR